MPNKETEKTVNSIKRRNEEDTTKMTTLRVQKHIIQTQYLFFTNLKVKERVPKKGQQE